MTRRASAKHATDHHSERPHQPDDPADTTAEETEERNRQEDADSRARARDAGPKARRRSQETPQPFGRYPAIH